MPVFFGMRGAEPGSPRRFSIRRMERRGRRRCDGARRAPRRGPPERPEPGPRRPAARCRRPRDSRRRSAAAPRRRRVRRTRPPWPAALPDVPARALAEVIGLGDARLSGRVLRAGRLHHRAPGPAGRSSANSRKSDRTRVPGWRTAGPPHAPTAANRARIRHLDLPRIRRRPDPRAPRTAVAARVARTALRWEIVTAREKPLDLLRRSAIHSYEVS